MMRRFPLARFRRDRRGVAAAEFALIAPALIFMVMGVLEMTFRFRASEEATRYVHEVADLISREDTLATSDLTDIYKASVNLMKPLDTTAKLDLDIAAIGFKGTTPTPTLLWRRYAGAKVPLQVADAAGMAAVNESVIWVGVRYRYTSVLTTLFGGGTSDMVKIAYTRPRETRLITLDGKTDDNGKESVFGT